MSVYFLELHRNMALLWNACAQDSDMCVLSSRLPVATNAFAPLNEFRSILHAVLDMPQVSALEFATCCAGFRDSSSEYEETRSNCM